MGARFPRKPGGLRLSGGQWRSRLIAVPDGARPTEGRVREALFDRWQGRIAEARVLDLFCGSGAVALEALSRGAADALGIDVDPRAVRVARQNAELLGAAAAFLHAELPGCLADGKLGGSAAARYDLVFADPPYSFRGHEGLIQAALPWLDSGSELVLEHSARVESPPVVGRWRRHDLRRYGESALSAYRLPD